MMVQRGGRVVFPRELGSGNSEVLVCAAQLSPFSLNRHLHWYSRLVGEGIITRSRQIALIEVEIGRNDEASKGGHFCGAVGDGVREREPRHGARDY